jgi:hypothetical protein
VEQHYGLILGSTLTLLSLIVGFSFSMAVSRYDLRKNCEENEANAIGTEYLRAALLPAPAALQVQALFKQYLGQRIVFYASRNAEELRLDEARTAELQLALWAAVADVAKQQPTPLMAVVVEGMNEVINTQGYTQAAWWNRIPTAAWVLMVAIAVFNCALVGYGVRSTREERLLLMVAPAVMSLSMFLVAEIDSPRSGLIRVLPHNLQSVEALIGKPAGPAMPLRDETKVP